MLYCHSAVSVVANQTQGLNFFKGVMMQAHQVTCVTNTTIFRGYSAGEKESLEMF